MTNRRNNRSVSLNNRTGEDVFLSLRRTDRSVLRYLDELALNDDGQHCIASIPQIAEGSDVSERQVTVSIRRLIEAKLIERVGYDLTNSNRTKRGTVYKVLVRNNSSQQQMSRTEKKRSVKFFLFWSEE